MFTHMIFQVLLKIMIKFYVKINYVFSHLKPLFNS